MNDIYENLKAQVIRESERKFEALMAKYPYIVDTGHLINKSTPDDYLYSKDVCRAAVHVRETLRLMDLKEKTYFVFPTTMGKYINYANSVMFEDPDAALLFKLML